MIFEINESYGKCNNQKEYDLNIESVHYRIPNISNNIANKLKEDLSNSINTFSNIDESNDIKLLNNVVLMEIGIKYSLSIIFILFNQENKAIELLDYISDKIDKNILKDEKTKYVIENIDFRYIEAYRLKYFKKYNSKSFDIKECKNILFTIFRHIEKCKERMNKNLLNGAMYFYYVNDAYLEYEDSNIDNAISLVKESYKYANSNAVEHLLDTAFLSAIKKEYSKSFNIYTKLKNKNQVIDCIDEICEFFANHIEKGIDYEANIFCECIVNYYFRDKEIAKKDLKELENLNINAFNIISTRTNLLTKSKNNKREE